MKPQTMHVRIGRLVVDAAALESSSHAWFAESLRQEIVQRRAGEAHGQSGGLTGIVAGQVASRISQSTPLPGSAAGVRPIPQAMPQSTRPGNRHG